MKRFLSIAAFFMLSLNVWSDTIDFWEVYINDSLVAEFNGYSKDLSYTIDTKTLNDSDKISIRYFDDTPCTDCAFVLYVMDLENRKFGETTGSEHFGKLSFNLKDLRDFGKENRSEEFHFFFYERDKYGESSQVTLVLKLSLQ